MKRLFTFTMLCMLALITVNAQTNSSTGKKLTKANVTGFVKDSEDGEALVRATIQIMTPDTAHLAFGGVTNNMGGYTIKNVTEGDYVVKISYLGYHDFYRAITVKNKATIHNVGTVLLTPNSIMLADAVVTGKLPQMEVKEDTIVFNADAFKTPEGSVLEDLIKKLPGAQVDNNGDITINGKKISKILVGGKEFFGNDKQMSMKNLPTEIIDRISTYDKASDQERLTGIQDGQEETVIDLTIKKGMQKGWFGNISAGVGTEEQFANRIMINRFQDNAQASIIGNLNSNGGGGMGMGRGASGKSLQGSVGANIVVSKDDKYEIGGNLRYNSSNRKNNNRSASERYVTTDAHTFSDQLSKNENFSDQGNAEFKIEVQVDSFTTMLIRPVVGLGNSGSNSTGLSATYNADPYQFNQITNPLNQWDTVEALMDTAIVNHGTSANKNRSDSKNASANFTLSHRYKNKKQRNLSINGSFNYTKNDGPSFNASNTKYYQVRSLMPNDTIYRYRTSPNHNTSFGLGATFSEPIATNLILQFTYNFQHSNRKSDNDTYDMGSANKAGLPMPTAVQHAAMVDSLASLLGYLPDNYFEYYDSDLSNYNRDINDNHNINLQLRWNSSFITSSIGVQFQPQRQHLEMKYMGKDIDTTRTFLRVSPTINFRYRFNRQNQLNFTYRGNMQQPSITDMIDMTDDSNPLNIRKGNPSLKPSFSNNFNIGWNDYITATMQTLFANFSFSNTMNSISSRTTYYKETGKSITQPENINGNWNINGSFGFNTPLFANERFMLNSSINTGYNNNVSFLHQLKKGSFSEYEDFKNTTNNLTLGGNLSITYRTEFWDIRANGRINYRHQDNKYLEVTSPNTYDFSYGIEGNGNWDNGWGCATNFSISSRRGYASSDANTNEAVWNAQVSYRFLKGRAATVSLQAFDILNQRSNFSRAINANGRSDTWTESINNYYMLTFQYRFNFFGSASGRRELRAQRRGMGGGMMGGGVPMF